MIRRLLVLLPVILLLVPALAQAKRLGVVEMKSNSVLTDNEKGVVYGPELMLEDKVGSMWVEGEGNAGLGKYVEAVFDGEVELSRIRLWAGCFVDKEFWERHNRVRIVELKYPDFTSEKIELKDTMAPQWLELAEPKTLSKVKIYLRAVYEGNTWNDTVITKIQFFDAAGPEEEIEGLSATASSTYEDEDNSYAAQLAVDGWLDTHWVEGGGTGEGEYLDIRLPARQQLHRFAIAVGNDVTESFFQSHNRAKRVTLSFSDGSSQSFSLEEKRGLQSFDLSPVNTNSVRVTFVSVVRGKSFNDLYVADVRFW
jgi:hypothetical protein